MSEGATASANQNANTTSVIGRLREQLRANPLVPLLIAGAAVVAIVAVLLMWASGPSYRVLYSNLTNADGGRIISELDSRGVPYQFRQGGEALMVPADQVHTLRLQLAEQGLPQGGNVGLELMQDQSFGVSQFAEQVNYQRGLQGELAQSMESIGPVSAARVHLALPQDSVFVRDREPAKASVVLTLQGGRTLSDSQVNAITHMVSSSVPDLPADAVTVVNQSGDLLTAQGGEGMNLDGSQLEYVSQIETAYQNRIESILSPILGAENIRAQVTAQVDFSQREETSEQYAPNQTPDNATVRSRQSTVNFTGGDGLAGGIPGALSNTPPGFAQSPVQNENAEGEDGEGDGEGGDQQALENANSLNRDDVVNYEVDRNITYTQHQQGEIERLSAAVVVNYRPMPVAVDDAAAEGEPAAEGGEGGEGGGAETVMEPSPLSDEEIAQIEQLARQAMGFSADRNDQLAVVNRPFTDDTPEVEPLEWWQEPETQRLALSAGRYLAVGFAALMLYLLILRPLIKRVTQPPAAAAGQAGRTVRAQVGDEADEAEGEPGEDGTYERTRRKNKASSYQDNLNDLREMTQEDPRMVAMIVSGWVNENG
jgi:flagellar M-ring protein FliF